MALYARLSALWRPSALLALALCLSASCDGGGAPITSIASGRASPEPLPALAALPNRIVPANVAAAEYLCALVDVERVAALPEQIEDFSMLALDATGWDALPRFPRYFAETLVAFEPDLVITFEWQEATTTQFLRTKGIPVLVLRSAESYEDVRATVELLGRVLGVEEVAAHKVRELDERVATLTAGASRRAGLRALIYSNTGTGGWAPGLKTTSHTLIELTGMSNVAAEAGIVRHGKVDFERFLMFDPDVIVVNELVVGRGSASKDAVTSAAPLASLKAVRDDRILVLPAELMSADSPEIVTAAEQLAEAVDRMIEDGLRPR
jgi:iron complex transport system substrate-binding protein